MTQHEEYLQELRISKEYKKWLKFQGMEDSDSVFKGFCAEWFTFSGVKQRLRE